MDIRSEVEEIKDQLVNTRRDFHRYPEAGWLEYRTASIVATRLEVLGFEVFVGKAVCKTESRMGVPEESILKKHENRALSEGAEDVWVKKMEGGHTGVVGVLDTGRSGPVTALRFDMDSLEITESDNNEHVPVLKGFRSRHDGVMHACGHDGHLAIGLGIAEIIAKNKDRLSGEVRLLFQPAEEGARGAKSMVDAGWLDRVDYLFCSHIAIQSFQLGEIVATVRNFLATTKMDITYYGKTAHAGNKPEDGKNALLAAAAASLHLNGITRHSEGKTRVNVGSLYAGSSRNVIPDKATMAIETRGETAVINEFLTKEAVRIIENVANVFDVSYEWKIMGKTPEASCSEELIPFIKQEAKKIESVNSFISQMDFNASEDAVYMINKVQENGGKATYMLFGSPLKSGHHENMFDFDENVLLIAVEMLSRMVFSCVKWRNDND